MPPANRQPITRTRTGCLTCRKRRKKCDEAKPVCRNCERNAFTCEGYERRIKWTSDRRKSKVAQVSPEGNSPEASTSIDVSRETIEQVYLNTFDFTGSLDTLGQGSMVEPWDDTGIELAEFSAADFAEPISNEPILEAFIDGNELALTRAASNASYTLPKQIRSLPPLVDGVESPSEYRLFQHFVTSVGPQLVLEKTSKDNSFTEKLVDFALSNSTVMKTLFSISASHLAQGIESNNPLNLQEPMQLRAAGVGYYMTAVQKQQELTAGSDSTPSSTISADQLKAAFAVAMLLTQYDTCEGGSCGIWQSHLEVAKALARRYRGSWNNAGMTDLIDWFKFHETLSRFSYPEEIRLEEETELIDDSSDSSTDLFSEFVLIGPRDGLFDLLNKILDLRRDTRSIPIGTSIRASNVLKGMQISSELQSWICPYFTEQARVVAECYRWAAYLILHATIHRSSIKDSRIKEALAGGLEWLEQISALSNDQTCSLFPMFALGIAALEDKQRDSIRIKMTQYWKWSGLGNVLATKDFLESWWANLNEGDANANWWDWQMFAISRGITVTLV